MNLVSQIHTSSVCVILVSFGVYCAILYAMNQTCFQLDYLSISVIALLLAIGTGVLFFKAKSPVTDPSLVNPEVGVGTDNLTTATPSTDATPTSTQEVLKNRPVISKSTKTT